MIKVICVGKVKESFYRDAIIEFQKRLSKYTKLEIIEVSDVTGQNLDENMRKEAQAIEKYIGQKDYVITLEIDGKQMTSPELATKIDQIFQTNSTITFIIGGSYGLDTSIKNRSHFALSFSKMTFPHQLFRVILLEQIYRAFKIMNHESYHK
ncbi:MAG: 23S rRNA (pseudouridine(1915)-N(3))-methyltransferase RlmH [Firmicutes bacterium]|nr:23S rRNA (pseudouridine(1915)-N(3))-methyltransferase RlmH [Bacillota bacterium]